MRLKKWFDKDFPIMGFGVIPIMSGKDSEFLVKYRYHRIFADMMY